METKRKPETSKELLAPPKGPGVQLLQAPKTFKFARSSVLSQVQSFLPELAQANTALQQRVESEGSEGVAVECNEEEEKKAHIEMDLAVVPLNCSDEEDDSGSEYQSSSSNEDDDERVDDIIAATAPFPLRLPAPSCRPSHSSSRQHKTRLVEELVTK